MAPPPPRQSPQTAAVSIGERAAVFAFASWLTCRKQVSGPFGADYDAGELAALADRYCTSQGWSDMDPNWTAKLRPAPKE
jgi:hypothetical protein